MGITAEAGGRDYWVRDASWSADRELLRQVREPVFVDEQKVPPDMEWDEDDPEAFHALAVDRSGQPSGPAASPGTGASGAWPF